MYAWTQPPKNAFCRPQETRTTNTDGPPTLQAGSRHPRGRACPMGWPSAAPVPVDAGHPVWGVVPPCGDAPIQSRSWSAIIDIMREKRFCTVFGSIALQERLCMGASPHGGTTPPNRVPGVYGDRRRGWPPHRAGSPPGIPGARLQRG